MGQKVLISWTAPDARGWAIKGYKIYIRHSDPSVFSINTVYCDGMNDTNILAYTNCTVPISTLVAWPYSLPWGYHVWAKVIANNGNGDSLESVEGNGA